MSRNNLATQTRGRTPWRPWVQLRFQIPNHAHANTGAPDSLSLAARRVAPPSMPYRWQEAETKRHLVVLCDWLQERLANPVEIRQRPNGTLRIEVFESLVFWVFQDERKVVLARRVGGRTVEIPANFEIGRPLSTAAWLEVVLEHMRIRIDAPADLFFTTEILERATRWITETAHRLLLREPAFQELRRITLPRALARAIPQELLGIALACRIRPEGPLVDSETLNHVWRNDRSFRLVARENPQLLPLLAAYVVTLEPGKTVGGTDPVAMLKQAMRDQQVSEAGWRYVVRHGSRIFRIPWETAPRQPAFKLAIRYLNMLERAGLSPPPPPAIVRALLHGYNLHEGSVPLVTRNFSETIDAHALRAGLLEADRRRGRADMTLFAEEFLGVCWWSEALAEPLLDPNQSKAPWRWFVRQWREAEVLHVKLADTEYPSWTTRSSGFVIGTLQVVPIRTAENLLREGMAMRNCLETYLDRCASGEMEVYSVRDRATGKRKACIAFKFDSDGYPTPVDVKGFANTPPKGQMDELVGILFGKILGAAERSAP